MLLRRPLRLLLVLRQQRNGRATSGRRVRTVATPPPAARMLPRAVVGPVVGARACAAVLATCAAAARACANGGAATLLAISRRWLAVLGRRVRRWVGRALGWQHLLLAVAAAVSDLGPGVENPVLSVHETNGCRVLRAHPAHPTSRATAAGPRRVSDDGACAIDVSLTQRRHGRKRTHAGWAACRLAIVVVVSRVGAHGRRRGVGRRRRDREHGARSFRSHSWQCER